MSFLDKQHTTESYFEKIKVKSKSYKRNTLKVIKHFETFCMQKYSKPKEAIFEEIISIQGEKKDRIIYEILQDFSNYLTDKIRCNTQNTYFSGLKPYLAYMTYSKIHSEDIRQNVVLPKPIEEEPYPISIEEQRQIFKHSSYEMIAFCLFCASTGIRQQEACKIRKRDIIFSYARPMVKLPGKYTKTGKSRRTFMSLEATEYVQPLLSRLSPDGLVFTDNEDSEAAAANIRYIFDTARKKAGFDDLRYDSGTHKITIHGFRAFFITQTDKAHEGLGHALAGHVRYMKRYERFTDQELLDFYLKVEPSLTIFSDQKNAKTLEEALARISYLEKKEEERQMEYKKRLSILDENILKVRQLNN